MRKGGAEGHTQTLTMREKPKETEMYINTATLKPVEAPVVYVGC